MTRLESTRGERWGLAAVVCGLLLVGAASPADAAGPGIHGRVFALDEKGKITGMLPGATIELRGSSGTAVARATSGPGGYYKINAAPGQYFYKVQAPGFKDEDHGRGIALELAEGYAIYNFSLTKGPNDPQRKPPIVTPVEIGRLRGRVVEKARQGLVGIPHATITLRKMPDRRRPTRVLSGGEDKSGRSGGRYEVILEAGMWRAAVSAEGFETFLDPQPITIVTGRDETRDFVLVRTKPPEPTDQGIRGIVTVRDPNRRTSGPTDIRVSIVPTVDPSGALPCSPDGKGGYSRNLRVGRYTVAAYAKGYRPARSGPADVLAGKYTIVNLTLVPLATPQPTPTELGVLATVFERLPGGKGARPVPGASVLVRKEGGSLADASRGTSDRQGQARLRVRSAGEYVALAQLPGYKSAGVRVAVSPAGKNQAELFLERLGDAGSTPGQTPPLPRPTPTPTGEMPEKPVSVGGYVVYRDPKSPSGYYGVPGTDMLWQRADGAARVRRLAVAGELGRYGVELPEGSYMVELKAPQGFQGKREQVTVRRGMDAQFFVLARVGTPTPLPTPTPGTLEPMPSKVGVRGRVVTRSPRSPNGLEGVAGAELTWIRGGRGKDMERATSGRSGEFGLSLSEGLYEVVVKAPQGFKGTTERIQVRQGMQAPMLVLARVESTPSTGPLGSTTPGGGKTPGGSVDRPSQTPDGKPGGSVKKLPSGSLDRVPGSVGPVLQKPGAGTTGTASSVKQTLTVRVVERVAAAVKTRVAAPNTVPSVRAVGGAAVTISQGGRTVASGRTDQNGRYSVSLASGSYEISVAQQGFGSARDSATISMSSVSREITLSRQTTSPNNVPR